MTPTPSPRRLLVPRRAAAGALAALVLLLAPACGGDDGDEGATDTTAASDASSESTDATDGGGTGGDAGGTTAPADDGLPDVDLCAEVTAEDISAAFDGAEITEATPNEVIPAPTCDYLVAYDGIEAPALSVTAYADGFLEGQRASNPSASDAAGLDDALVIDDLGLTVIVSGPSADYSITRGIELTSGGEQATEEQVLAAAALFQEV